MRYVLYSRFGDGIPLVPRLQAEGNEVALYMESGKETYSNLGIPKLKEFKVRPDDIVVFDMVGKGKLADELRAAGHTVIGSSMFGDRLELDRNYGTMVMKAMGIEVPDTKMFTTFEEGIRYAEEAKKGLFFKPHGNKVTSMTFGDDDPKLVAEMMEYYSTEWEGPVKYELQEKVEGIELSIEGWFNGRDWIPPFNSTIEDKKLAAGDLGPNTGSMSSVVWAWQHMRPRIARETLLRLTSLLRKAEYVGPLDINTKGGFGLEFSSRFGYDAFWALAELLQEDVGSMLYRVATGTAKKLNLSRDFAFALRTRLVHDEKGNLPCGAPVSGLKFGDPHVWFMDVMGDQEGELVTCGVDGMIATVTASGRNVDEARRGGFALADQLKVPNLLWRTDAGLRAQRQIKEVLDTYVK